MYMTQDIESTAYVSPGAYAARARVHLRMLDFLLLYTLLVPTNQFGPCSAETDELMSTTQY